MAWPTTRMSKDPLVIELLSSHKFNLLSVPREHVNVYDIYIGKGRDILPPSQLVSLFDGQLDLPIPATEGFKAPEKKFSSELELGVVGRLTAKLFAAHGASLDEAKFSGELKSKGASNARIKFFDVVRDSVGPVDVHLALSRNVVRKNAVDLLRGRRIYLVVGVVRAKGLEIVASNQQRNVVKTDLDAADVTIGGKVRVGGKVSTEHNDSGGLIFHGAKHIAFGVELVELELDPEASTLRVDGLPPALDIRDARKVERVFIGDSNGPIFVDFPK